MSRKILRGKGLSVTDREKKKEGRNSDISLKGRKGRRYLPEPAQEKVRVEHQGIPPSLTQGSRKIT